MCIDSVHKLAGIQLPATLFLLMASIWLPSSAMLLLCFCRRAARVPSWAMLASSKSTLSLASSAYNFINTGNGHGQQWHVLFSLKTDLAFLVELNLGACIGSRLLQPGSKIFQVPREQGTVLLSLRPVASLTGQL